MAPRDSSIVDEFDSPFDEPPIDAFPLGEREAAIVRKGVERDRALSQNGDHETGDSSSPVADAV